MNNTLELSDIQGFALRGYGYMDAAVYKMLKITDSTKAKKWLAHIIPSLTTAHRGDKHDYCVNLAFSYYGLQALKLPKDTIASFDLDFREYPFDDAITKNRLRTLGDIGKNAPNNWHWGKDDADRQGIHLLLMIFAKNEAHLGEVCKRFEDDFGQYGLAEAYNFPTVKLPDAKEHFGFHDGIGQPEVEGYRNDDNAENIIKAGEFILGYVNEYNILPESPWADAKMDAQGVLPAFPDKAGYKDVGKNGTYMVFRQLEQDVKGFWEFVHNAAKGLKDYDMERLGAKIVGRWRSGAPVTLCPMQDKPELATEDNFNYAKEDIDGMKCPIGAHIRRSNPRDAFMKDAKKSVAFARKHRLMRRGRSYGNPFVESFDLQTILDTKDDGVARGLYFIATNANFGRQFNFIQQTWINDGGFQGLNHEPDVLLGSETEVSEGAQTYFSMPQEPIRQRIKTTDSYIRVRGSMNFFLPSVKSMQWIANL